MVEGGQDTHDGLKGNFVRKWGYCVFCLTLLGSRTERVSGVASLRVRVRVHQ